MKSFQVGLIAEKKRDKELKERQEAAEKELKEREQNERLSLKYLCAFLEEKKLVNEFILWRLARQKDEQSQNTEGGKNGNTGIIYHLK